MSKTDTQKDPSQMWGGRFKTGPSEIMEQINASIGFDKRMFEQDIAGSKAHCAMLVKQGVIEEADGTAILEGLDKVLAEIRAGEFSFSAALEDIHMNVESRLKDLIGEPAGRLHTGRSRNDQVATDFRLWTRETIEALDHGLKELQRVMISLADDHADTVMPGFTHLQAAQPITFGHHMLAYVEMIGRDRGRLSDCRDRLNESPLGAAALAGTPYPIDREMTASALGFAKPMANSLDAVSSRDFALEFLSAASICGVHLSRLSEEIVIWGSAQFRFVRMSDAWSTGSSIMPQKRNPDAAELVRAKVGRLVGALNGLFLVMKGLPLAYSKDMQEDKEPVFEAADALALCIAAMTGMLSEAIVNKEAMRHAAGQGFTTATDLADWCVQKAGTPFREAHHISGALVAMAEERGCDLSDLSLADLKSVDERLTEDAMTVLSVEHSVAARTSYGGAAPERVREQVALAKQRFLSEKGE